MVNFSYLVVLSYHVSSIPCDRRIWVPGYIGKEKQGQAMVLAVWEDQFHPLPVTVSANYAVSWKLLFLTVPNVSIDSIGQTKTPFTFPFFSSSPLSHQ